MAILVSHKRTFATIYIFLDFSEQRQLVAERKYTFSICQTTPTTPRLYTRDACANVKS